MLLDSDNGTKHIVIGLWRGDGTRGPPVIFTSDKTLLSDDKHRRVYINDKEYGIVIYEPGVGAPSAKTTSIWIDKRTSRAEKALRSGDHLLLDALRGHFADSPDHMFKDAGVILFKLPEGSGKYLNPPDQAIHRELRRLFRKLQNDNRNEKVLNIIRAYYGVRPETIKNSFRLCGIFEGDPEEIVQYQASQGYRAEGPRAEALKVYEEAFAKWKKDNLRNVVDVTPQALATSSLPDQMDGVYWKQHGTSRRSSNSSHKP